MILFRLGCVNRQSRYSTTITLYKSLRAKCADERTDLFRGQCTTRGLGVSYTHQSDCDAMRLL